MNSSDEQEFICDSCFTSIDENDQICPNCGESFEEDIPIDEGEIFKISVKFEAMNKATFLSIPNPGKVEISNTRIVFKARRIWCYLTRQPTKVAVDKKNLLAIYRIDKRIGILFPEPSSKFQDKQVLMQFVCETQEQAMKIIDWADVKTNEASQEKLCKMMSELIELRSAPTKVTFILFSINVVLFILMAKSGFFMTEQNLLNFLDWGISFSPVDAEGQYWRLITYSFIHGGYEQMMMNMWALLEIGTMVEKIIGSGNFLILFLMVALGGSISSMLSSSSIICVGANGAIFGLLGFFIVWFFVRKSWKDLPMSNSIGWCYIFFIVSNLIGAFVSSGINNSGVFGGFITGAAISFIMSFNRNDFLSRKFRMKLAAIFIIIATVTSIVSLNKISTDFNSAQEVDIWYSYHVNHSQAQLLSALAALKQGKIKNWEISKLCLLEFIPTWENILKRLNNPNLSPSISNDPAFIMMINAADLMLKGFAQLEIAFDKGDKQALESYRKIMGERNKILIDYAQQAQKSLKE